MTTEVHFGKYCVRTALSENTAKLGTSTLVVTTGRSLNRLGYVDELLSLLKLLGIEACVYDQITANPDVSEIHEAINLGKQNTVSSVIGFGGGSAIDAAKASAVGIVSDIDVEDFLIKELELPKNTLPIIAIPTTAGTGSELTKGAIISSREKRIKTGIRGEEVTPTVAIVDPSYTFSCPMDVTMEAGFDVFTHAAESFCAIKATPISKVLSEKAIRIVGEALPRLKENLNDQEAREMMCFASHIMGYNVKNIGNCLPHRLQYPIGIETDTSHGAGLIALYPAWIKYEHKVNPERIDQILDWLGCEKSNRSEDRMKKWLENLGINRTINDLSRNKLEPQNLAKMVSGNLQNDELSNLEDVVIKLYSESM